MDQFDLFASDGSPVAVSADAIDTMASDGFWDTLDPDGWSCRWTRDGLRVERRGRVRVYGHWRRLFGFWEGPAEGPLAERLPDWPVLDRRGAPRADAVGADAFSQGVARMLMAFLAAIPQPTRRLAAPFGKRQWMALDLAWHAPGLAALLERAQAEGWTDWLAAKLEEEAANAPTRAERQALAARLLRLAGDGAGDRREDWVRVAREAERRG